MNHKAAKAWSLRWIAQHLASLILLIGAVLAAAIALTALVIGVEEIIALIFAQRFINTYTNVYGNAWLTIFWHFTIVFSLVTFWSAVDTFIPENKES
ncbi:hypothetical protein [Weissella hellenica]|uniref:Uncharacterized protein n=1 Tax=Weissella hellenica TaxID=46256 RepID=A0A4Y4FZG8_WEIHE|nr:hypothetical protein [Weissella hellenica]NKY66107.1 hypothetical protein [Weissella hellenica]GED35562.1 hypothetical protein WHE01_04660 [Weissella hellenica]SCB80085.1 hypothetical protein GA0061075_102192 [Weissella hellenica]